MSAEPDLTELQPLSRIIAEKIHTVPVRHCPGGTDDLVAALTLAVAIYVSRHVLPPGLPAAVVQPATMSEERAAELLAPLEAKVRALGEQRDAEHRAAVLREAADIAESLRQFERATGARWSAQVSENVGILRVADELRRLADAASGPGRAAGETQQDESTTADRAYAAGLTDTEYRARSHAAAVAAVRAAIPGMYAHVGHRLEDVLNEGGETQQDETQADGQCCGDTPPDVFTDNTGRDWHAGDCWCTRPPGHDGEHQCEPCTKRVGAPGWTERPAAVSQPGKEA